MYFILFQFQSSLWFQNHLIFRCLNESMMKYVKCWPYLWQFVRVIMWDDSVSVYTMWDGNCLSIKIRGTRCVIFIIIIMSFVCCLFLSLLRLQGRRGFPQASVIQRSNDATFLWWSGENQGWDDCSPGNWKSEYLTLFFFFRLCTDTYTQSFVLKHFLYCEHRDALRLICLPPHTQPHTYMHI